MSVRLPLRFLRGQYGRLALTIVALACGVALLCAIDLVNRAVYYAFSEVVDTMAGRAALQITAGEGGLFPEEIAATAASVPGVELAVPVVSAAAFTTDGSGQLVTVHGVDVTNDAAVHTYEARDAGEIDIDDPLVFLSQPDSVLITRTFAAGRKLSLGDSLELETPSGRQHFTVRGLIEPMGIGRVHGGNLVVMDVQAAERWFTRPGLVNRVDVVVDHAADVSAIRGRLVSLLPKGLDVTPPAQRKVDLHRIMQSVQVLLQAVGLLGLVAAFLIVFNRLSAVFEGRVWQVGIMRAMGLRPGAVWFELLAESLLLGILGTLLGLPLGVLVARVMLPVIATTTAIGAKLTVPTAELAVRWHSLGAAAFIGVVATMLAAALPGWRAARMSTATVLRARGLEQPPHAGRFMTLLRASSAVTAFVAVMAERQTRSPTWGLVASFLLLVAAAFAARPLVEGLRWSPLRRMVAGTGASGWMALAALERNPRRTALTVATLGIGFGVVTWLWVLAGSVERSVIEMMPGIFRADLVVSSVRIGTGYVEAPVDETLVGELSDVPGVGAVVGEQVSDWQFAGGPVGLNAFDSTFFTNPQFDHWPLVGAALPSVWEALSRGEMVIVSTNLSHNIGVTVGDVLRIDTPSGPLAVRVGGMTHDFLSPRGTILMSRELYRRYWHDRHITHALIRTLPGADLAAVRAAIAARGGARYGLRVLSVGELVRWFADQARKAFFGIYALGAMVLVVVALGVADTVAAGVLERQRELAVMGALGVRPWRRGTMILIEACLLGLGGVILALTVGLALGVLWVRETFPDLVGWVLRLHVPGSYLLTTAILGLAVCVMATLIPAYRSTRVRLAEALRYD